MVILFHHCLFSPFSAHYLSPLLLGLWQASQLDIDLPGYRALRLSLSPPLFSLAWMISKGCPSVSHKSESLCPTWSPFSPPPTPILSQPLGPGCLAFVLLDSMSPPFSPFLQPTCFLPCPLPWLTISLIHLNDHKAEFNKKFIFPWSVMKKQIFFFFKSSR